MFQNNSRKRSADAVLQGSPFKRAASENPESRRKVSTQLIKDKTWKLIWETLSAFPDAQSNLTQLIAALQKRNFSIDGITVHTPKSNDGGGSLHWCWQQLLKTPFVELVSQGDSCLGDSVFRYKRQVRQVIEIS